MERSAGDVLIHLRIPATHRRQLRLLAAERDTTVSALIRESIAASYGFSSAPSVLQKHNKRGKAQS